MIPNEGVSHALARFVAETRFEQLNQKALIQARHALLDGLGVSLAATGLGEGCEAFRRYALNQNAAPQCAVWGSGEKTSAPMAAFANGALAHALDFEDTHDGALVHPNAAVIPAALAVAETQIHSRVPITGADLLTAIAIGCDVVCRLGLSLTVPLDNYGWYPPPILSAFGATAAAAHLYRLNSQQVLDAFSLTLLQATCSAEIKYNPDSVIRAIRDAFPAQAGVVAAQLAAQGIKGFAEPFEGKAGFFAAYARGHYEPSEITRGLGENFEIANLSFKAWPSCRGTHAFIDGLALILKEQQLRPDDIADITVYGNNINRMLAEPLANKQQPSTSIDAKFSIPFCLAWTAVHGEPSLASFLPSALMDPEVIALAKRINYQVEPKFSDTGPGMLQARVKLITKSGQCLSWEGSSAPGAPDRPLSDSQLRQKFLHCCEYVSKPMSVTEAQQLANSILTLEQQQDLSAALFRYL